MEGEQLGPPFPGQTVTSDIFMLPMPGTHFQFEWLWRGARRFYFSRFTFVIFTPMKFHSRLLAIVSLFWESEVKSRTVLIQPACFNMLVAMKRWSGNED